MAEHDSGYGKGSARGLTPFQGGEPGSPAEKWEKNWAKRALDELFTFASKYRSTDEYKELLRVVNKFWFY